MSYPRNAASPEPIAIGSVVKIADGAVQTSGCTVRIKPNGVDEGDGAGTTSYSTDGVVLYTPTQGETNYTSFILIAKKTDCIPANVTVITSAQSVPGLVALETATQASIDAIEGDVAGLDGESMRGTDGANTTAPDNTQGAAVITALGNGTVVLHADYDAAKNAASQYTADADHDLTQATIALLNFATPTNVTDAQTAIISQVDANETKIDTLTTNLATVDTVVDGIQTDLSNATDGLGALKAAIDAIFTTAIAESYAADGADGTPAQILYLIQQAITEFSISGTTKTIKKLNGSTTAATETLDDATNPTSITRAT